MAAGDPSDFEDPRLADAQALLDEARALQDDRGDYAASRPLATQAEAILDALPPDRMTLLLRAEVCELDAKALARDALPDDVNMAMARIETGFALIRQADPAGKETFRRARLHRARGFAAFYRRSPEGYQASIIAYDEAIDLARGLDLAVPGYRYTLAAALRNKADALQSLGGAEATRAAIAADDEAIGLARGLDLAVPRYRETLAVALGNKAFALRSLGGAEATRAAIAADDEAIGLARGLDLAVPRYRETLAIALRDKAFALQSLGGAEATRAAIAAYDEAIDLARGLDLAVPGYRDTLAGALRSKAFALQSLGGAEATRAAIIAYDEAIDLARGLDLAVPGYRDTLAGALRSKAFALQSLGGAEATRAAIAADDEAIGLARGLDLAVPRYRDTLAVALRSKAFALQSLGGAEATRAAIIAYNEAIGLARGLDLAVPGYVETLAGTLTNYGRVLWLQDQTNAEKVAAAFREALTLLVDTLGGLSAPDHTLTQQLLYLAFWYAGWLIETGQASAATDICDDALAAARDLEAAGLSGQRVAREAVFARSLEAYRRAGMIGSLPEVILEQLDPAEPGSAADSAAMHGAAAAVLRDTISTLISRGAAAPMDMVSRLMSVQMRLQSLHTLYFGGTAVSARLRAEAALARSETTRAAGIFDEYVNQRPADPDGWLARAEWRIRTGRASPALADLETAARLSAGRVPDQPAFAVPRVAAIARVMLNLRLPAITEALPADTAALKQRLTDGFDNLHTWLIRDLPDRVLAGMPAGSRRAWEEALFPTLTEAWTVAQAGRDSLLDRWFDLRDASVRAEVRQTALSQALDLIKSAVRSAPSVSATWADFRELVQAAKAEAEATFGAAQDPEEREARITETIANALRRGTRELQPDALANAGRRLAESLGNAWHDVFDERERDYLACALRCRDDAVLARYTVLELGCAVEWSLTERLFRPIRVAVARRELTLPAPANAGQRRLHTKLATDAGHLMLGELLRGFNDGLARLGTGPGMAADVVDAVADTLRALPNPAALAADDALRERRKVALFALNQARTDVAHARAQALPAEHVNSLWVSLVEDADIAFFRWFPAAFAVGGTVSLLGQK